MLKGGNRMNGNENVLLFSFIMDTKTCTKSVARLTKGLSAFSFCT